MPASQPYGGNPAVRNDREGRGTVGIIRSPVRASTLPDCGGRAMKSASLPLLGGDHMSSCPALGRASTSFFIEGAKTWMAGTSPAMTGRATSIDTQRREFI